MEAELRVMDTRIQEAQTVSKNLRQELMEL